MTKVVTLDQLSPEQRAEIEKAFKKSVDQELAYYKRMGISNELVKEAGDAFIKFVKEKVTTGQDSTCKTPIARRMFITGYAYLKGVQSV